MIDISSTNMWIDLDILSENADQSEFFFIPLENNPDIDTYRGQDSFIYNSASENWSELQFSSDEIWMLSVWNNEDSAENILGLDIIPIDSNNLENEDRLLNDTKKESDPLISQR